MKVMRNGRWVDLEKDNARLAAEKMAREEQRKQDEEALRQIINDAEAMGDQRFAEINRRIGRAAGIEL